MQVNLSCVFTGGLFFFPLLTYLPVYNEADTCKMKDHVRLLYEPTLIIFSKYICSAVVSAAISHSQVKDSNLLLKSDYPS